MRPANLLIGNSIVHYWGGEPGNRRVHGPVTWDSIMRPAGFANLGCGWDKVENVLWRIYHGEIDHTVADNVVVMIGTNNLAFNTPQEIVDGIKQLLGAIRYRQPQARIILVGILPRRGREQLVADINIALKEVASADGYHFINPGQMLLGADGKVDESLLRDGLHPNDRGYSLIAPRIVAALRKSETAH